MIERLFFVGIRHRVVTLLLLLLMTVVAALGLPDLRVDTDFSSLISQHDPHKAGYERVTAEFGTDNQTIIYIRDAKLWTPEHLQTLQSLHDALKKLPFIERVDDVFTLQIIQGRHGAVESRSLLKEAPQSLEEAQEAQREALYNPLIRGNFVSDDGESTAILLAIRRNTEMPDYDHYVYAELEKVIADYRHFDHLFQMGSPRLNAELKQMLFEDMRLLAPLSAAVLMLVVVFFLRSSTAAVLPLLTSAISLIWTFGVLGWLGIPINILTAMLPSLVIVIGSTEDTHMISSYFKGLIEQNADSDQAGAMAAASRYMMRHMAVPTVLTVTTTALGFASNIFSSISMIEDFAVASTLAIVFNGIITLLFVPLLLSTFGPGAHSRSAQQRESLTRLFVLLFQRLQQRHHYVFLVVVSGLCGFFMYQASTLHVTNDPMTYLQSSQPLIQDNDEVHRQLSGMKTFFITLESTREKAFLEPKYLDRLVEIQGFIQSQGIFDRSTSLADYLALMNREFHDGKAGYYEVPRQRDLVAQYLMFFHRSVLQPYVSHDYRRANIVVRHNISDSDTLNRHIQELRQAVQNIAGMDLRVEVNGENLMINAATEDLLVAQVESLAVLLFVVFLLMSIMFTSFKGGLVALMPNIFPISLMFGMMGLMQISLNPGTAMVAVIAVGIAIDGTIHLFSRYNRLTRTTSDYDAAVVQAVNEEAMPMVATGLALAMGFAILMFSHFTLIAQFGALSAATVLFALFSNLILTPVIMSHIRLVGLHQILALSMNKEVLKASPLFQGLSHYEIRKAILISEQAKFAAGDVLMKQGEAGDSMVMILSGEVEIVQDTACGSKFIATMHAGDVFGEIGYIRETERTANVNALSDVEVLMFNCRRVERDLKFFPRITAKLNFNISRILGERLADMVEHSKP